MGRLGVVTNALERGWSAIRTVQPEVREAVIVVYLHPAGDRNGHYWQSAWTARDLGRLDEVHISSALLQDGAAATWTTLLHEAAHSLAAARGLQDVSRQGRYHNRVFVRLATELGLVVDVEPGRGAFTTGLTDAARRLYGNAIADLEQSIDVWQGRAPVSIGPGKGKGSRNLKLTCPDCGRILRGSRKSIYAGPIECVPCGAFFGVEGE